MTEVLTRRQSASTGSQPVRRRRTLPSGRAVVGGFLIMVAMVGTVAAYARSTAPPTTRYVVATRDLAPGEVVAPDALELVAIALPDQQRRRAFDIAEPLHGLTVVEPVLAGELLQEGAVTATASAGARTVSFALPRSRAVAAALIAGERIDVLATFGSSTESCTHLVAADVPVTAISGDTSPVAGGDEVTLTIAVDDAATELAVAHASAAGTVTVARTTGADDVATTDQVCTPASRSDDAGPDAS